VDFLRQTSYEELLPRIPELRAKLGDRAILRAIHFFADNARVGQEVAALRQGDFETFKQLVIESGHSSFEYLQNIYANCDVSFQGMSLALALAQRVLNGKGAWRVHGGGFGGTTQNFVPLELVDEFSETMEAIFGKGNCHILSIRPCGGIELTKECC
jgi:galactokinase